jgi:hypothetical protein
VLCLEVSYPTDNSEKEKETNTWSEIIYIDFHQNRAIQRLLTSKDPFTFDVLEFMR